MGRVVVVGAGLGGLAAAARLAALGHQVTVCEQAADTGGKLGWRQRSGFGFDTGPSLLTLPAVFDELGTATGGPLSVELQPVEPLTRYRFADGTSLDATSDLDAFSSRLDAALGTGSGRDWRALMRRAGRMWAATREPFVQSPLRGARTLAGLAVRRPSQVATIAPGVSLRRLGRRYLRDPRLRTLLDRYATYSGSDPRRAPAVLATVPYVEQTFGGWYVAGGLHRLAAAVRARAVERGATIRTDADVVRIELAVGRVTGVRLASRERIPADIVVANADASVVYGTLVHAPAVARRVARATPSYSGFALLLALRGRSCETAHHRVLFPVDYDAEFDALAAGRMVPDPTIYVSAPADPSLAPAGDEAWFVLVNAARQGQLDWDAPGRAAAYADRLLEVMAGRGVDVRDRLLFREVITPAELERATRSPGGAIYGSSSDGPRAAFLRPANRSPIPGLFLVGGSAHPGGGLPLVTVSARIVADLVGPA